MTLKEFEDHIEKEAHFIDHELVFESYLCEKCASADIDQQCWVGVNTGIIDELIDNEKWWCNNCNSDTIGISIEVFFDEKLYEKIPQ